MNKHNAGDLKQMQSLPLEAKIAMTQKRIEAWYESWIKYEIYDEETGKTRFVTATEEPPLGDHEYIESMTEGQVYVSFSGGKDSTVLKHIVDQMYPDVPSVFVNTGLEYPELQKFVRDIQAGKYPGLSPNVETIRPEKRFDEVLREYGYPVIGKKQANVIDLARNNMEQGKYTFRLRALGVTVDEATEMGLTLPSPELLERYEDSVRNSVFYVPNHRHFLDTDFRVSDKCCDSMKKKPAFRYQKESGRKPILATMADESTIRKNAWFKNGCNAFEAKHPASTPMAFWTEQDVLLYLQKFNVPYASVYGDIVPVDDESETPVLKTTGCSRTGCIFCMFGCHLEKEPNRFQRLKETHPRQWEYCIGGGEMVDGKWQPSKEGLGLGHVLDYMGVKYD